jgi:hypothetical protein
MPSTQPNEEAEPGARVVPQRTPRGQAELASPGQAMSRRHRTVLFLVDGRRDVVQIQRLAEEAGAGGHCLEELVRWGLVGTAAAASSGAGAESSVLPSSLSVHGDSRWSVLDDEGGSRIDRPLIEARALLLRAVRTESPIAGALTRIKLKRAATREALESLLDEVERRLRKPHRQIIAAQTIRHVRHLLSLPAGTHPPVG